MKVRFSESFLASHRINQRERMQKSSVHVVACDTRCANVLFVFVFLSDTSKALENLTFILINSVNQLARFANYLSFRFTMELYGITVNRS